MKRVARTTVCALLTAAMLWMFSGCSTLYAVIGSAYGEEAVAEAEAVARVAFATKETVETPMIWEVDSNEMLMSASSDYRSSLFFDQLSPEHQLVYKTFEYAMQNGFTEVYVDDLLVDDADTMLTILNYVALDSPLLEQNLRYETGTFTLPYDVLLWNIVPCQAVFDGFYVTVNNFEQEFWNKKQEAVKKAEEIVASMPAGLTEMEKAAWLYRYVAEHVEYTRYEDEDDMAVYSYVYDALLLGKTQCDGFANAIALLYRVAGIENAEKMYNTYEEGEEGHTWNVFCVDGKWYNADGTRSELIPDSLQTHSGMGFGFPDILQTFEAEHAQMYAPCEEGAYITVDAHLADASSEAFVEAVEDGYDAHDGLWALVLLDSCVEEQLDDALQDAANQLYSQIWYAEYECIGDRTAVLVYDGSLYEE